MIRPLLHKECREHRWTMVILVLLMGMGYLFLAWFSLLEGRQPNALGALRLFAIIFGLLGSILLSRALVTKEYTSHTQLFLETLPLSRPLMVAIKYGIGLAFLWLCMALATIVSVWLSRRQLDGQYLWITLVLVRTFLATAGFYSFFFMMGFLGRYRTPIFVLLVVGISMAVSHSFEIERFGPFALLDDTFATERYRLSIDAIQSTATVIVICILISYLLALTREGSVVALMAERMSHREKMFIAMSVVILVGVDFVYEGHQGGKPFDLPNAIVVEGDGVVVKMAAGPHEPPEPVRQLAKELHSELKALKTYLGMENAPAVFVTIRRDLDPHQFELGEVQRTEGLVVRANLDGEWRTMFLPWLVREWLINATQSRAKLEERRWMLDGMGLYWAFRDPKNESSPEGRQLKLRALYGVRHGFESQDLSQWLKFRERVGDEIACGVAWSGLHALEVSQGKEACHSLLQAMFGRAVPKDIRASFGRWRTPTSELFASETHLSYDAFFKEWQRDLLGMRGDLASDLRALPEITAHLRVLPDSEAMRRIVYEVKIQPAPPSGHYYMLYYKELPALNDEVPMNELHHESRRYDARSRGELSENYRKGARLFATFAYDVPQLGCPVISGWVRQEVP